MELAATKTAEAMGEYLSFDQDKIDEVKVYGIYDPADYNFNLNMWSSTKADDLKASLNLDSLEIIEEALMEPSLKNAKGGFQFLRLGYFCVDPQKSSSGSQVFNRIVTLRDSWAKISKK